MESWCNPKTLILSRADMMGLLTPAEYVGWVEQACRTHGEVAIRWTPKAISCSTSMPANGRPCLPISKSRKLPLVSGCRSASNRAKSNLPAVFSILIYTHAETGFPLAIFDGSYHMVMRTDAAAAVSAKWMALKNSKRLAIVGAGHMPEGTLATCNVIFAWEEVLVWSRTQATLDHFVTTRQPQCPHLKLRASTNLADVVDDAGVVVTLTPARSPIVMNNLIAPGTHIAALGADKVGDQELDPLILQRARILVDDIRLCRTDGEINVPLRQELIKEQDIAGEIGEVKPVASRGGCRTSKSRSSTLPE